MDEGRMGGAGGAASRKGEAARRAGAVRATKCSSQTPALDAPAPPAGRPRRRRRPAATSSAGGARQGKKEGASKVIKCRFS